MAEHNDITDLIANPAWEEIKEELEARKEVLLSKLLNLDEPEAIEYKLIMKVLSRPREMLDELRAEKQGGK